MKKQSNVDIWIGLIFKNCIGAFSFLLFAPRAFPDPMPGSRLY